MPRAILVVGLGNGDEGKGSLVDHLVQKEGIRQVVRFNGGAQALHHVVDRDRGHGFSQFGSGTLAGAQTVLSRFMLFEPLAFCREALALSRIGIPDPYSLVSLSARAPIIPPANILANRILEIGRGRGRHGSCGMGIGLTQGDVEELGAGAIYAEDLLRPTVLREKLAFVRQRRLETVGDVDSDDTRDLRTQLATADLDDLTAFYREFAQRIRIVPEDEVLRIIATENTVFEGAQGVLLDQEWGFFPHVTRSATTFANAETLLKDAGFCGEKRRIGLLRAYGTRHGAGPFPTETDTLVVAPCHNAVNPWQGKFRTGWFDAVTARYALDVVGGVDLLALTNLDRLIGIDGLKAAVAYRNEEQFSGGRIALRPLNREASQQRTEALLRVTVEHQSLPPMSNNCPEAFFRYADAVAERIGHDIRLISARADRHKLYR
ncbi:MAG: Adenylosuccinate synthase [Chthonomonadaceae bacterium]|nr:Adenylosuccinate synthase [Chthonomonadaceae bacterium]